MSEGGQRGRELAWAVVSGVHAGVLGGLAMIGWFLVSSSLLRQPPWTVPNLLGALINGDGVLRRGFGSPSLAGLALVLFLAGSAGAAFAVLTWRLSGRRRLLLGILVGLAAYYVSHTLLFRKLGAVAWVYASPRLLLVGHLLWGLVVGWKARMSDADGPVPGPPA